MMDRTQQEKHILERKPFVAIITGLPLAETECERALARFWHRGGASPWRWVYEWVAADDQIERAMSRSDLPLIDGELAASYMACHATISYGLPHGITLV